MPHDQPHDRYFYMQQAAGFRRQAATEADAGLKAELLVYATEFEAKAREQRTR